MNLKKGLVALAVTGALASPIAANAAATLVTYGGKGGIQQGPQAGDQAGAATLGIYYTNGTDTVGTSDHVTIDKIYVPFTDNGTINNHNVDYDANGNMPGSTRQDVSIAYTGDVTIPNEGTFTIKVTDVEAGGFSSLHASDFVFIAQVAAVVTGSGADDAGIEAGEFIEVGSVVTYESNAAGFVDEITVQVDTNRPELDGIHWVLSKNTNTDSTVIPNIANVAGFSSTTLAVDEGQDASKDAFQQADALPAFTQIFLASPSQTLGHYNPVTVTAREGAPVGSYVKAQVTDVTNTGGISLNALLTNEADVAEIVDGFALKVIDQATTTINVEDDRLTFIHDDEADEVRNAGLTSRAMVQLDNKADYGIQLNAADTLKFNFKREDGEDIAAVSTVEFGSGLTGLTLNETTSTYSLAASAIGGLGLFTGTNTYPVVPFDITVDGKNFLEQNKEELQDWVASDVVLSQTTGATTTTFSVPVVYAEEGTFKDSNSVNHNGTTHVWPVNGAQFKIPYIYSINTATGYGSSVKIVNEFKQEGDVFVDAVVAEAGLGSKYYENNGTRTIRNVLLGTVPGEGHFTQTGDEIAELLELDMSKNWHIELTYLVNAPQNSVHAAAQNKDNNGRADTPVLYKTNNVGGSISLTCSDSSTTTTVSPDRCTGTLSGGDQRQWQ